MAKEKNSIVIVVDVNVWVSVIIGKKASSDFWKLVREDIQIYYSLELLNELLVTLAKPRLQKFLSPERTASFLDLLLETVHFLEPSSLAGISRDPKDDYLLALSTGCMADFLITGDTDLLSLKIFNNTKIVTMRDFIKELK